MISRSTDIRSALRSRQRGVMLVNPYNYSTPPSDPYFANVVLLMHGQTLLLDSSSYARTVTASGGSVALTSSNPKWGTNSINFTSSRLFVPYSTDFAVGSSDFTVEVWAYFNSTGIGSRCYLCSEASSTGAHAPFSMTKPSWDALGGNVANAAFSGYTSVGGVATASVSTWVHLAMSLNSGSLRYFVNGVQQGATMTASLPVGVADSGVHFSVGGAGEYAGGSYGGSYGDRMCGQLADFRLTIGVGRYTSNFTPPTAQFPDH